ncbi:MAG: sensor histidine kinase [Planctomycetota bacterium]
MRERRFKKLSVRQPAILITMLLVLAVTLTVLWNLVLAHDYAQLKELAGAGSFHTWFIVLGTALFLAIIVLSTILGIQLIWNVRRSQRQSSFLASVSHELNSPLSSIKLFAQTLRRRDLSPENQASFAAKILVDTDRLSRLIANIVRAAEADRVGEELSVAPGEVDLRAYLAEFVEDAKAVYPGEVELTLTGDEVCVEIDPLMFRQVLDNLIDNAVRYCEKRPAQVELRIVPFGAWTELQVIDQGIGIPDDMLENIFERFYRIEEGEPQAEPRGMGIGLNIVRSIVRSHGGTVGARSRGPGAGAVIWIRLPTVERAVVRA